MLRDLRYVAEGTRDEYRGWHKFKLATGKWPVFSILAGVFSIPILFVAEVYLLVEGFEKVETLKTGRMYYIYLILFSSVIGCAAIWYGVRVLACKLDIGRAQVSTNNSHYSENLEKLIR